MSGLSEAIARADVRLASMSQAERVRLYHVVLREELQRGIAAQGTEARRAETGTGSVHDGPVPKGCAHE